MKYNSTVRLLKNKLQLPLFAGLLLFFFSTETYAQTQLGIYRFTGSGTCPNQNPSVVTQPANAVFSDFTTINTTCDQRNDVFRTKNWSAGFSLDLNKYNTFSIAATGGNSLTLNSISFKHYADEYPDFFFTSWSLRSSIDNYTSTIAWGIVNTSSETVTVQLPISFININNVSFRLYLINPKDNTTKWLLDDVTLNGVTNSSITVNPQATSNTPQCSSDGVTMSFSGTPPVNQSWYWQNSPTGTSTANSNSVYTVYSTGTYYLRAYDNISGTWGSAYDSVNAVINPNVTVPVFTMGATSSRCHDDPDVIYSATASNADNIIYSLDSASIAGGNAINAYTGEVKYNNNWNGTSMITATANGCGGPVSSTHIVTIWDNVNDPVFALGSNSTRCQGAAVLLYSATAQHSTSIEYSLDNNSLAGGNTINPATGEVTIAANWVGDIKIKATAYGCNGPKSKEHQVRVDPSVTMSAFNLGASSSRCYSAATIQYKVTPQDETSLVYSLDSASLAAGNTINSNDGKVTYLASWIGTSIITATAEGCNGPITATHTAVTNGDVSSPIFTMGATSTRCAGALTITYSANASFANGITYSLDAASITGGNTINAATGEVTFSAGWNTSSVITASATGCAGPQTAIHTVSVAPIVGVPVFASAVNSTVCQGSANIMHTAIASNTTGITYSIDAAAALAGNTIDANTGSITPDPSYNGNIIITATAAGCGVSQTAALTITLIPVVGMPAFSIGATSERCESAETIIYNANASDATNIIYTLDAVCLAAGNSIDSVTGAVTYLANWTGNSTVTATAIGCGTPLSETHTVYTKPAIQAPVFMSGSSSTRCQGADLVAYEATAINSTSIIYTLDSVSTAAGNSINPATGDVTYDAGWAGTSIITAIAGGCGGPITETHTAITNAQVGTPVFALGANSSRCQSAENIIYTTTADYSTGITYSMDAASIAGGNTIDSITGSVIFLAGWNGISIITATATGCGVATSATHEVSSGGIVQLPVFLMGTESVRTQAAGNVTYTATAANSSGGITYNLDPSSIAGGNNIDPSTGTVTWDASWFGVSLITASAYGCGGNIVTNHLVTSNSNIAQTPLYLSVPGLVLDRIDPVATGITAGSQSTILPPTGANSISFIQQPALCSNLIIKAQTISVIIYVTVTSGSMPAIPSVNASIKNGANTIISLNNPVYNAGNQTLTWTGILASDANVPAGQALALSITNTQSGVSFAIDYHSMTKPSRISLLPVSTFINFLSFDVYDAPYPGGAVVNNGSPGANRYLRATVSTPFGYSDITGLIFKVSPPGTILNATCVDSTSCTRTYQYAWTTPPSGGVFSLVSKAYEGYENNIYISNAINYDNCSACAPLARMDSAIGNGGAPLMVDVLANDTDPNNDIKLTSLSVLTQPNNGTAYKSNGKIVYLPNGTFAGRDTLIYQICDSSNLCSSARLIITINPLLIDPCSEATKAHTYYLPYPEQDAYTALKKSASTTIPSNNIRTVISVTIPYPGMRIVWDHWEDGYELNPNDPLQSTTLVWGDGNPYNGLAPGYPDDNIPTGGKIVLDNTMPANPRVSSNIFYDGKDKVTTSGQVAITQVCGEPTWMPVQAIKTNVTSTLDFGQIFTVPLGENYNSADFRYTSLFVRAAEDSTSVDIDKDNNGTFESTINLNQGQSFFIDGGVKYGATVVSSKPVGIELNAGGVDQFSIRNSPIYPASWYSNTYFTPVPTSDNASNSPKDSSVVMLYNSLSRPLTINWYSGAPATGTITLPAKMCVRFPLAYSTTDAYKFVNLTGESFTAIEVVDSYTPGGGGNSGETYDWSFNLISEARLTDFTTTAWAPGGLDLVAPAGPDVNGNPIWVTPNINTTIYVKYDGNINGTAGFTSPCGLKYDVSYNLNALKYLKIKDPSDNDQSGIAIYTCNGAKIAAVYGEDPQGSGTGIGVAYWDVGATLQPFCKQKMVFANDDYAKTLINQPVTIPVLINDLGFLATIDPASVNTIGLRQPKYGSITINSNGTILYTPNPGYLGKDTFEYAVCSTPSIVCDYATVYVQISNCPNSRNQNLVSGNVFLDRNKDGVNNDGGAGVAGTKVYFYIDGNCNTVAEANELKDSVTVDASGSYQFLVYPEKSSADDFDNSGGASSSCATGSDGNSPWATNWVDAGDPSTGVCNAATGDCELVKDMNSSYSLRLKNRNVSGTRTVNLTGSTYAFLTFSYRKKNTGITAGKNVLVQVSTNGSTFNTVYTIAGNGTADAGFVTIHNQDISSYISANTYIRFLTNNSFTSTDTVYIDDVKIQYLKYPICYITKLATSTVPANHYTTSPTEQAISSSSSTSCFGQNNFGVAKTTISISGTLYNDGNGLTDSQINGNPLGTISTLPVFVYLVDALGKVNFKTVVNSTNGTFLIPAADITTSYKVTLSTVNVAVGTNAPVSAGLPSGWVCTGDAFGINNMSGTGLKMAAPTSSINVTTGLLNITSVNFGMQRLPNSDDKLVNYSINLPGNMYDIPALSGSDSEDGLFGMGNTFKITSLPTGSILYYNFVPVTLNQVISSFNPAFLKIDPNDGLFSTMFTYASRDAGGYFDLTPAVVRVNWGSILPVTLVDFNGKLNGSKVDLFWSTSSESNSSHFEVERSDDGVDFKPLTTVKAKGFSNTETNYTAVDPLPLSPINYYRLKMVDNDNSYVYSRIINIKVKSELTVDTRVMPNPFTGKLDIYITLPKSCAVSFSFIDVSGKVVYSKQVKGLKGFNWFVVNDLERLPTAPYILTLVADGKTYTQKLIKQ